MKRPCLTYLFLSVLLPLLFVSCRKDPLPVSSQEAEQGSGVYVSIVVNTESSNASRVPTPGEDGDGKQPGTGDENKVYDLTVFFLDDDLNSAKEICASAYFDEKDITPEASGNITLYTVQKEIEGLYVGNTYHVLVIVNAGDLTNDIGNIDALKNKTFSDVILSKDSGQWFLMASEKDSGEIEIRANNSEYNPTWVTVNVERMTARVDCAWDKEYIITGDNMPSESGGYGRDKVKILGAALVNRYNGNTYAFKRVTEGTSVNGDIIYLGDELLSPSSATTAGNYVLDPLTASGKSNTDFDYYYPEYLSWDTGTDFYSVYTDLSVSSTYANRDYYRLSYTKENVNSVYRLRVDGVERYATGIMFKAQYTPDGFTEGTTFYVYPKNSVRTVFTRVELFQELENDNISIEDDISDELLADLVSDLEIYKGGECYYIYWIRHADDDNDNENRISVMEFAIVRNNIYQLYINSIEGLGSPEPDSHIEELEEEIHLYVKAWTNKDVEVPAFD